MNHIKKILIFSSILYSQFVFGHTNTKLSKAEQGQSAHSSHPTLILVHGALLTSSVWAPVQSYLQNNHYNVVTLDTPGRLNDEVKPVDATLSAAVEKLCKVINMQNNSVLLVGHSQAGAIITQATQDCGSHIKGLVYIAAVVPPSGEKVFDLLGEEENLNFDRVAKVDPDSGLAIIDYNGPIEELFIGDANDFDIRRAINNMVSEPIVFGDGVLNYEIEKFNQIPKFYVKTLNDRIIFPETQDKYIKRQSFREVIEFKTGHSPFVVEPKLLGETLARINNNF